MLRWIVGLLALALGMVDALAGTWRLYTVLLFLGGVLMVASPTAGMVVLILAALTSILVEPAILLFLAPLAGLAFWAAHLHRRKEREREEAEARAERMDRYVRAQLGE